MEIKVKKENGLVVVEIDVINLIAEFETFEDATKFIQSVKDHITSY